MIKILVTLVLPEKDFFKAIKIFMRDAFGLLLLYLHVVSISFPGVVKSSTCSVNLSPGGSRHGIEVLSTEQQ